MMKTDTLAKILDRIITAMIVTVLVAFIYVTCNFELSLLTILILMHSKLYGILKELQNNKIKTNSLYGIFNNNKEER